MGARALRSGSSCLDLRTLPDELAGHVVPADLANRLAASPLAAGPAILHVEGDLVFLDRYWRDEGQVRADLLSRIARPLDQLHPALLQSGHARSVPASGWPDPRRTTQNALHT